MNTNDTITTRATIIGQVYALCDEIDRLRRVNTYQALDIASAEDHYRAALMRIAEGATGYPDRDSTLAEWARDALNSAGELVKERVRVALLAEPGSPVDYSAPCVPTQTIAAETAPSGDRRSDPEFAVQWGGRAGAFTDATNAAAAAALVRAVRPDAKIEVDGPLVIVKVNAR